MSLKTDTCNTVMDGVIALLSIDVIQGGSNVQGICSIKETQLLGHNTINRGSASGGKLFDGGLVVPSNICHHLPCIDEFQPPIEVRL